MRLWRQVRATFPTFPDHWTGQQDEAVRREHAEPGAGIRYLSETPALLESYLLPTVEDARAVAAALVRADGFPKQAQRLLDGEISAKDALANLGLSEPAFSALARLYQAERRETPCANCGTEAGRACHPKCHQPRG